MKPIYLDNNATTFLDPEVATEMQECYRAGIGNPASQHGSGRLARRIVEEARDGIADLLGANVRGMQSDRLIFTSGGTESNNLAIRGMAKRAGTLHTANRSAKSRGRIVISAIEHPSVTGPAEYLAAQGFELLRLPVDSEGVCRLAELNELLSEPTCLVSVMLGNNETGVLQPLSEIAALCRQRGVPVHTDAVQAVGKVPVNFHELHVDALSLTGHKFHGPVGIGGLLVRKDAALDPILFGGFQQQGLRPGTEPVALIKGLLKALQVWHRESSRRHDQLILLRDRLAQLLRAEWPELVVNGSGAPRLPHTLNVAFPGIDRQALVMALDLAGVACSSGSACASGSSEPSPVLLAMGLGREIVESSIRFSLSALTTESEVVEGARRIGQVLREFRHGNRIRRGALPPRVSGAKTL